MKKKTELQLLKEYVRVALREDEYGDIAAGFDSSAYNSGSVHGGEMDALLDAFVKPSLDALKTAVGKTKEITRRGRTVISTSFITIATTLIPGLKYSYKELFEEEEADIQKIKSEYQDVYQRTDSALAANGFDTAVLAFMAAPGAAIAAVAAKKTPGAAKEILSTMTGGTSDKLFDKVKGINFEKKGDETFQPDKNNNVEEYQIVEDDEEPQKKKEDAGIDKKILTNKKFIAKALDNPRAKSISAEATKIYRGTLNDIFKHVQSVMKDTKSIGDLQKLSKKPIEGIEKLKDLQGNEKKKAEEAIFKTVRKTMKDFYIKELTDHYKSVIKAGIPEDSQYIKDYKSTIEKIKALN